MNSPFRPSGIAVVGDIPWGAHFCQFYRTKADLAETLVPYFEAGLRNNESCLWVTSHGLDVEEAQSLMIGAVPEFQQFIASGQMEIISLSSWYNPGDAFDADLVLQGWLDKEVQAKARGFAGLRLSGDTAWLERSGWSSFMEYEHKVGASFGRFNLVALCTYRMDHCTAEDVIDVCTHHQFALTRRHGEWELLESSSLKIAKDKLVRVNSELESRVAARTADLSAAVRARDEFLAMLGHELRNPLAPIHTASEVIRALTPADSPLAGTAAILHRQVGHLTRLVDDLLDVARVTQSQIQLALQDTPLADIIALAVEQSRPMIDQRMHSLSVAAPSRAVRVHADPTRLAQVFGNLLHNAAKYTPDGGAVGIAARVSGSEVSISVTDTGSGIPAPMLDSIFELFTQLPRSLARSDGGLGVGLTLARRIVEMHGGTITAYSDGPDMGTEFVVRLALAAPATDSELAPAAAFAQVAAAPNHRVLLVDDNSDARDAMAYLLRVHGLEVQTAFDGNNALALARSFNPSVVLLDIGLPDMEGYEVARRLRASPETRHARLIALTGYGQSSDILAARDAGFDAHILKPAQLEDVLAKIGAQPTLELRLN